MQDEVTTTGKAALAKALAKAQKMVFAATKDAKNPFFNSKYATLAEVLSVVRDPLADNGFALVQDADTDLVAGTVGVVSKLMHESGAELYSPRLSASLKSEFNKAGTELPPSVQQIGSMVTYLRRYSLCAFLSVAIEDDDGNAVTEIGKGTAPAVNPLRTSAHTGEKLATPEAVAKHMEAAKVTGQSPTLKTMETPTIKTYAEPVAPPVHLPPKAEAVENKDLAAALMRDRIHASDLAAYLMGNHGSPRIATAILQPGMSINSLGDRIITSLLAPKNWNMVVERINADDDIPF